MVNKGTVFVTLAMIAGGVTANDLNGTWKGTLNITPQQSLKIVFHVAEEDVTMDSPDQNAYGIGCKTEFISSDSLSVSVASLGMNYAGRLENDSIIGTFRQGFYKFPLILVPGEEKMNRPQTPQAPFPYSMEEVRIEAPAATLASTLTIPSNADGSTPVVVLVSGSGQQNRDEELFEHKPFAVIADFLARNGIASLRYDDRGCGESTGTLTEATTADFAEDAAAVAEYLRKSERFSKVGLIGHSEGGTIAYILGSRPGFLDFIVSVAGPSVDGAMINAYQNKVALLDSGIDAGTAEDFANALLKTLNYRLTNPPLEEVPAELLKELYPGSDSSLITRQLSQTITATLKMQTIQPWMEYFLRFDPVPYLRGLKIPAFVIYGEKDCQVPPSLNLEPAKNLIPGAEVKVYPSLNHLMQHAVTGKVNEYKEIEETFAPEVLADIVAFIRHL